MTDPLIVPPGVAYMYDPSEVPRPPVKKLCDRCRPMLRQVDVKKNRVIVSHLGTAHWGADYGETACGVDATGPRWWWPL